MNAASNNTRQIEGSTVNATCRPLDNSVKWTMPLHGITSSDNRKHFNNNRNKGLTETQSPAVVDQPQHA